MEWRGLCVAITHSGSLERKCILEVGWTLPSTNNGGTRFQSDGEVGFFSVLSKYTITTERVGRAFFRALHRRPLDFTLHSASSALHNA